MTRCFAMLALVLLAGCGATSEVAGVGGGGFEGETVMLQGVVRRPDGRPMAGAAVGLQAPDWTQGDPGQVNVLADDEGRFSFRVKERGVFQIEARKDGYWTHRQCETSGSGKLLDVPMSRPMTWRGRISSASSPSPVRIRICGGSSSATVSEGAFQLERDSSQAVEWAKLEFADGTTLGMPLPNVTDSVLDPAQAGSVLVDDFEGSGTRSVLGALIGSGWWYALSDSASGGTSGILPAGVLADFRKAYSTVGAWRGSSLAASFAMDTTRPVHYAELGLELANQGLWVDLSRMDSLSFMAKGKGRFRFQFVTSSGFDPGTGTGGDYAAWVDLDSGWSRIVLKRSDFVPRSAQQNTPVAIAFAKVRRLLLISESPLSLGLDELRFHGTGLSDLIPRP